MLTIDLSERVAAVTGAGTGLGLAIARELAQAGAQVAVLEIDPASGPAAAEELRALGVTANAYAVDVGFAHIAVTCDDLDELLARLVEAEGRPVSAPVTVDAGANAGARAVYV